MFLDAVEPTGDLCVELVARGRPLGLVLSSFAVLGRPPEAEGILLAQTPRRRPLVVRRRGRAKEHDHNRENKAVTVSSELSVGGGSELDGVATGQLRASSHPNDHGRSLTDAA